jgi:hypothetical protein
MVTALGVASAAVCPSRRGLFWKPEAYSIRLSISQSWATMLRFVGLADMSSANVEVVFEGPAVQTGTIDARLLAESLLGYSEVFTRANDIVNGEVSHAVVLVQSEFKRGSLVAGLWTVRGLTPK